MESNVSKPVKLVIIGDSISDCGRMRPVGEGHLEALGDGYVRMLDAAVKVEHPEWHLHLVNMGIGGNTSRDLVGRWQTDLLALAPKYVLIQIGINDVWRHFDRPLQPELHVSLTEYRSNLDTMIDSAAAAGCGVILCSPFFLEPNREDPMRAMADQYRAEMERCAQAHGLPYIDLQTPFDALAAHYYSCCMSADRVHPNTVGQYVITRTIEKNFETIFGA